MCGLIAGFSTTTPKTKSAKATKAVSINDLIINQYEDQYNRGQKGFGIVRIAKNGKVDLDRATEPQKFLLDLYMKPATMIVAHHRTPTSTENKIQQTHPIKVSNKQLKFDYYVVHNGMISNDEELKKKHEKEGFVYTTKCIEYVSKYYRNDPKTKWNDSEAIAIELALFIEGKIKAIRTDNSAAFIVVQVSKKAGIAKRCFFGRNGFSSALNMSKTKGTLLISSEGKGDEVKENKLYSFNVRDEKMKLESKAIPFEKEKVIEVKTTTLTTVEKTEPTKKEVESLTCEQATLIPIENEPITEKDKVVTPYELRAWIDVDTDPILDLDFNADIFTDKKYKENLCEEFSFQLKGSATNEIKRQITEKLEEEVEKITELAENFKDICQSSKIQDPERNFFLAQIANQFKAMEAITDIASEEYIKAQIIEDKEEIADYNAGFHLDDMAYSKETGMPDYDVGYRSREGVTHIHGGHRYGQGIRDDDDYGIDRF